MIILCVDYGDARTGLAVCDKSEILASPVGTVFEKDKTKLMEKIAETAKQRKAEMLAAEKYWPFPTYEKLLFGVR